MKVEWWLRKSVPVETNTGVFREILKALNALGADEHDGWLPKATKALVEKQIAEAEREFNKAVLSALEGIVRIGSELPPSESDVFEWHRDKLQRIHDIAAGVLGDDEDVRTSKNAVVDARSAIADAYESIMDAIVAFDADVDDGKLERCLHRTRRHVRAAFYALGDQEEADQ